MSDKSPTFPANTDPFNGFLDQLKTDGSLYCSSSLTGDWCLELPAMSCKLIFHIVTEGECRIIMNSGDSYQLTAGEMALVPHGDGHIFASQTGLVPTPFFESGVETVTEHLESLTIDGTGRHTELVCGVLSYDGSMANHLIRQLPSALILRKQDVLNSDWIDSSIALIKAEARSLTVGSESIITHIGDILIVQIVRHWLSNTPEAQAGWFLAMKDQKIGHALGLMHQYPDKKWTVEALGRECGMSRSNFSARFTELVGKSVKSYLMEWRMLCAYQQLKVRNTPLVKLASSAGYESEAAFSRAFKRVIGLSPSQVSDEVF